MGPRLSFIKKPKDIGLAIKRLLVLGLPAVVIVGAFGANIAMGIFTPKPEEKEQVIKATPVVVADALSEKVRLSVNAQGEARPLTQITLTSQVSGKINFVAPQFIEGGAFEAGDVLVRIEPAEYKFRVVQARANVAQARSRYASEEAETRIARKEWDELGEGEGSALARREPQMAEAEAALASAQAQLHEAELQLERTVLRAPFKGRVQTQFANIGQFVRPGDNLGDVFSTDVMEVALPLTDAEIGELGLSIGFRSEGDDLGPEVILTALVGGAPRQWQGHIAHTDSSYDRQTRVLFAYAQVVDPYGEGADDGAPIAAGLFVNAEIQGREIDDSVIIPRTALRGNDQVFVATDENTLEIRQVTVASSDRTRAILIGGLRPGEQVITSPVRGAAEGIEIAVAGRPDNETTTLATATN